ncbi:MFS transporter [Pseudomonas tumuqii]|uniref:MFS transporter n=1 Tax=Pseudomonas tumuqii TaxID=2715755 RepID=UPI001557B3B8|nr:MFS transporter [Pseudomonas tumuqii]
MQAAKAGLSPTTIFTLAICCGLSVATVYYNQAMLPLIGQSFGISAVHVGQIAMLTQIGYAFGLLLFVPLGDRLQRKTLILVMLAFNALSLVASALAPSFVLLLVASAALGLSAISAQIIIPAATVLAAPAQRGQVLGMMVSGLSAGGLLARALSGVVSTWLGWRGMYLLAAGLNLLLALAIFARMPTSVPSSQQRYLALMRSLWDLLRQYSTLRWSALIGALTFGALNVFWGAMASLLAQPTYGYSSAQAGLFGLSAVFGILCSAYLGRLTARHGMRLSYTGALVLLITYAGLYFAGELGWWWLILLVASSIDLGNRANQLASQTRALALAPEAVSRLNTVFMVAYFCGGALGSMLGSAAAGHYGWQGLGLAGGSFALVALLAIFAGRKVR